MEFPKITVEDKVAVVTGGGRGLGRVGALAFAAAGADVVVASRSLANCEAVAEEIRALGRQSLALEVDVTKGGDAARMIEAVEAEFGRIDILFNNAGMTTPLPAVELPEETWRAVIETNLTGTFLCSQAAARSMISRRAGKIINMGSVLSNYGMATRTAYSASKAGIAHFTKSLALELGPYGITVNAIAPTVIFTELNRELQKKNPQLYEGLLKRTALGRFGQPEDIGGALVFLASPAADFITGQTIYIDGGYTAG
jgi:NAD(P)-dependent dehydrogenase (short-subunit alcohol dehydrogenase family)